MSLAHENDAYANLESHCQVRGYDMLVGFAHGGGLELRVVGGGRLLRQRFTPGRENQAAGTLLKRLGRDAQASG